MKVLAATLGPCSIRRWEQDDALSLARHANDREVWRNLRDRFPHPYTLADAEAWLAAAAAAERPTSFAIAVEGQAVGSVGFIPQDDVFRRSAEVGYWLGRAYWGRGIATLALCALTDWLFTEHDICRLFAGVFEGNTASMRVLEKAGFTREARLRLAVTKEGRTVDEILYAQVRE